MNEGATVLVVRPRAQALAWVAELDAIGVAARALPLIDILPAPRPGDVEAVLARLEVSGDARDDTAPMLVFVSPNAVLGFFAAAAQARGVHVSTLTWPAQAWAAATGPGTVAALRECGVPADRIAAPPADSPQFDSEALWAGIAGWHWPARPVWIVRGNGGRDWLGQQLRGAGADVRVVQSYGRAAPALSDDERALLAAALSDPARWVWIFSSSEAIDHLETLAAGADWRAGRALASHPRIAERAVALGFGAVDVIAPAPAAVAAALAR
ncbi:MAG: uroporphyrinogen-III synthase [Betaproteobacteria bacterium]